MSAELKPGERIDDLQRGGLRIIQRENGFRFGTDAVLLADFAAAKRGERVCDMGTGTGVLPLLLSARAEGTTFDAFEVQPDVADMARRSVALNGLEERIRVHCADCREAGAVIGHETVQLVVTNPPYTAQGAGLVSPVISTHGRQEMNSRSLVSSAAFMNSCWLSRRFAASAQNASISSTNGTLTQ